jgi:hypothetical protein
MITAIHGFQPQDEVENKGFQMQTFHVALLLVIIKLRHK